ncbi:ATP-binding cassette sub-family A member 1-like [Tropilaelaps mercedesae]|uniref:ATP-binding cassette sub-family A member 1-like n=1 Tax=Tropilaelaps mercedesae TaxID=418985 RepID=A0A1V9XDH9_9ACAR|nr:ATP-binding cassette sub-family A member 1-like [Tropilaelaps mercedesae]
MVEKPPAKAKVMVRLWRITHSFGHFRAVNNLSLDLYSHQITMLLGHNGAGKTTTMNILTGLIAPQHGDVFINGYSVRSNTRKARESLGLCPQHNTLFDELTVVEHLVFFAMLKGAQRKRIKEEVHRLLSELDLMHKSHTLSKDLSGGMKRKLCLANAMVGGSQIVILDEPTAGMDPEARRSVWGLLQEERRYRTILMTTHYMEEADILGDRIAFLSKGRLLAAGSPMFLKKKFETGYNLRIGKQSLDAPVEQVVYTIQKVLSSSNGVNLDIDFGYEFVVNIGFPDYEALVELFRVLEDNKNVLGIQTIGISVTTMEDVFHKVGQFDETKLISGTFSREAESVKVSCEHKLVVADLHRGWLAFRREVRMIWYLALSPLFFSLLYCSSTNQGLKFDLQRSLTYSIANLIDLPLGFITKGEDEIVKKFGKLLQAEEVKVRVLPKGTDMPKYLLKLEADEGRRTLWYNGEPYHVGAAAMTLWQTALLSQATGNNNASVTVTNLPRATLQTPGDPLKVVIQIRTMSTVFLTFAVAYLVCHVVLIPIDERVSKAKLVQVMTGVPRTLYVTSNAIFDALTVIIAASLIVVMFILMDPLDAFVESQDSSTGLSVIQHCTIIPSFILGIVVSFIEIVAALVSGSFDWWVKASSIVPSFAATWAISSIHLNGISRQLCDSYQGAERITYCSVYPEMLKPCCQPCTGASRGLNTCFVPKSPFALDSRFGCGYEVISLMIIGSASWGLLFMMEMYYMRTVELIDNIKSQGARGLQTIFQKDNQAADGTVLFGPDDPDVQAERRQADHAISSNRLCDYALVVQRLVKYYGTFLAVNKLSFVVNKKECFGLLGVNGAGKSTTFGMLTGDIMMSAGNAFIRDIELRTNLEKFQKCIGYCPQENILIDKMTGTEMLELFCALRGVSSDQTQELISYIVHLTDLDMHAGTLTTKYSGGTKRKLCIALALVGNPPLLFLDEPTAGIDPGARRKIWGLLAGLQRNIGSAILLTSHSMEECEALCQRIAIMVGGSLRCIGSSQSLKTKYSQGFTVLVKLALDSPQIEKAVVNCMQSLFPSGCRLKQSYQARCEGLGKPMSKTRNAAEVSGRRHCFGGLSKVGFMMSMCQNMLWGTQLGNTTPTHLPSYHSEP